MPKKISLIRVKGVDYTIQRTRQVGYATISNLSNIPNRENVIANLASNSTFSITDNTISVGDSINIICKPTADFTQLISGDNIKTSFNGKIEVKNGSNFILKIDCYDEVNGVKQYFVDTYKRKYCRVYFNTTPGDADINYNINGGSNNLLISQPSTPNTRGNTLHTLTNDTSISNSTYIGSSLYYIDVAYGDYISYTASRSGYNSTSESNVYIYSDKVININLSKISYNVTISTNKTDASIACYINDVYNKTITSGQSISVPYDSNLRYVITRTGYQTFSSENQVVYNSYSIKETLIPNNYNITFSVTPSDATITYSVNGSYKGNVINNIISVPYDATVTYNINRTGYIGISDDFVVDGSKTITESLEKREYDVTFNVNPVIATIKYSIDNASYGDGTVSPSGGVVKVLYGSTIYYQISAPGFDPATGSQTIYDNTTINRDISLTMYNVTFTVSPGDATVTYNINGGPNSSIRGSGSVPVRNGSTINYTVSKTGYDNATGSQVITGDTSLNITLQQTIYNVPFDITPGDAEITYNINGGTSHVIVEPDTSNGVIHRLLNSASLSNTSNIGPGPKIVSTTYGTTIYYTAVRSGYENTSGNKYVTDDSEIEVSMSKTNYYITFNFDQGDATVKYRIDGGAENTCNGRDSIYVPYGSTLTYTASRTGYNDFSGSRLIYNSQTITEKMIPINYDVTFNVSKPSGAGDVIIYVNGQQITGTTYSAPYNSTISYTISAANCEVVSGTYLVNKTSGNSVSVQLEYATRNIQISVTPSDATIAIYINNNFVKNIASGETVQAIYGDTFKYIITRMGYTAINKSFTVDTDKSISETMSVLQVTLTVKINSYFAGDIYINGTLVGNNVKSASADVAYDSRVTYEIRSALYETTSGSYVVDKTSNFNITVVPELNKSIFKKYANTGDLVVTPELDFNSYCYMSVADYVKYEKQNFALSSNNFKPIGIVISCAGEAINDYSYNNMIISVNERSGKRWGNNTNIGLLYDYNNLLAFENSSHDSVEDLVVIYNSAYSAYLPSDSYSGNLSMDAETRYDITAYKYFIPSPFESYGGSLNYLYYAANKDRAISPFCDFSGSTNTDIMNSNSADAAVSCKAETLCYGDKGKWFLPGLGELGIMINRMKMINDIIDELNSVPFATFTANKISSQRIYWSSTERAASYAWVIKTDSGRVEYQIKTSTNGTIRPFLKLP